MDSKIKESINSYVDAFLELPIVKSYFLLKKSIEENQEIQNLKTEINLGKKSLKSLSKEDRIKKIEELKIKENTLYNHPLIINYKSAYQEIYYRLDSLKKKLEIMWYGKVHPDDDAVS